MSSRKMSESSCRPTVTTSVSSRKRLPALAPRCTISSADPYGNALTAASSSAVSESVSRSSAMAGIALVVSPVGTFSGVAARAAPGISAEPHWPQKLLPSGFSCPQLVQNGIASTFVYSLEGSRRDAEFRANCKPAPSRPVASACHLFGIGISIQQVVQIGALVQLQLEEPAVPVWIGVDGLWVGGQQRVHCGDHTRHR